MLREQRPHAHAEPDKRVQKISLEHKPMIASASPAKRLLQFQIGANPEVGVLALENAAVSPSELVEQDLDFRTASQRVLDVTPANWQNQ